jgi:hypothetical protein
MVPRAGSHVTYPSGLVLNSTWRRPDGSRPWTNFLGRVTKARILQAVAEAKGQRAADRIEHLKKGDMAAEAQTLLAGTGWTAQLDPCAP